MSDSQAESPSAPVDAPVRKRPKPGERRVQILQALSRLEQLRGEHEKSKRYRDRAKAMMQTSPAKKLPAPIWQVKVPPGGPYPVNPAEPAKEVIGVRH